LQKKRFSLLKAARKRKHHQTEFFLITVSVSFDQKKINQVLPLQSLRTANFMYVSAGLFYSPASPSSSLGNFPSPHP